MNFKPVYFILFVVHIWSQSCREEINRCYFYIWQIFRHKGMFLNLKKAKSRNLRIIHFHFLSKRNALRNNCVFRPKSYIKRNERWVFIEKEKDVSYLFLIFEEFYIKEYFQTINATLRDNIVSMYIWIS